MSRPASAGGRRSRSLAGHAHQFIELLRGGQEVELACAPKHDEMRGKRGARKQGTDQDIRVDDQPHVSPGFTSPRATRGGDSFLDQRVQIIGRHIGECFARLGHGLIAYTPFHRVFDELREVAFFRSAPREEAADRDVGAFGY